MYKQGVGTSSAEFIKTMFATEQERSRMRLPCNRNDRVRGCHAKSDLEHPGLDAQQNIQTHEVTCSLQLVHAQYQLAPGNMRHYHSDAFERGVEPSQSDSATTLLRIWFLLTSILTFGRDGIDGSAGLPVRPSHECNDLQQQQKQPTCDERRPGDTTTEEAHDRESQR